MLHSHTGFKPAILPGPHRQEGTAPQQTFNDTFLFRSQTRTSLQHRCACHPTRPAALRRAGVTETAGGRPKSYPNDSALSALQRELGNLGNQKYSTTPATSEFTVRSTLNAARSFESKEKRCSCSPCFEKLNLSRTPPESTKTEDGSGKRPDTAKALETSCLLGHRKWQRRPHPTPDYNSLARLSLHLIKLFCSWEHSFVSTAVSMTKNKRAA